MIKVEYFMNGLVKKMMIYSMVGLMQVGFGTAVVAASPLYNDGPQQIVQLDRQSDHDQRQHEENERHEREMRQHDGESDRDWHERQDRENERHNNTMNEIEAGLIGIVIGSQLQ
jgi:ABC-type Zn2+ transport system substrate-binding protein/surface adhesin